MKNRKKVILGSIILIALNVVACGQLKESETIKNTMEESATNQPESSVQTVTPEIFPAGEYCDDMGELIISRIDEQNYTVDYGIYKLAYVKNAAGSYDVDSGILSFSGTDDSGNLLSADAAMQGDEMAVTLTHSAYPDCPKGTTFHFKSVESQSNICAYIREIKEHTITIDIAEYITADDVERMNELKITEDDMPDGYYIYNSDNTLTQYNLTGDTVYIFQDSMSNDTTGNRVVTSSREDFITYIHTFQDSQPDTPFFFNLNGTDVLIIAEKPME